MNKNPIKVCFVAPKAYPLFNPNVTAVFGGAEVDLYHIATELAKQPGYNTSCVTADYGQSAREHIENVSVIKSFKIRENLLTGSIKVWNALKRANADIYVLKTASLGAFLVFLFCKLNNKHFVYRTAHQDECDGTYTRQKKIAGHLFKIVLRNADLLITQNEIDNENLRNTLKLDSITIPNGHRINKTNLKNKHSILWVGRSADFKRPERFLELAKKVPTEKFIMICQHATEDSNYEALKKQAISLDNVEFIERVPFHEIDDYFSSAKILVNTSDSEGFSNTFIQACKASTAILSYNVNPDDFLTKYKCGMSCQGSNTRMKQLLEHMLMDNKYRELGQNGRRLLENKYDIKKIIKRYVDYFNCLVKGNYACAE